MAKNCLPYYCAGEIVKGFGRGSKDLGCPTGIFVISFSSRIYWFDFNEFQLSEIACISVYIHPKFFLLEAMPVRRNVDKLKNKIFFRCIGRLHHFEWRFSHFVIPRAFQLSTDSIQFCIQQLEEIWWNDDCSQIASCWVQLFRF